LKQYPAMTIVQNQDGNLPAGHSGYPFCARLLAGALRGPCIGRSIRGSLHSAPCASKSRLTRGPATPQPSIEVRSGRARDMA
jgi:hypothetical protein